MVMTSRRQYGGAEVVLCRQWTVEEALHFDSQSSLHPLIVVVLSISSLVRRREVGLGEGEKALG